MITIAELNQRLQELPKLTRFEDADGWRFYEQGLVKYISVTKVLDCVMHEKLKAWFQKTSGAAIERKKTETAQIGSDIHKIVENDCRGILEPVSPLLTEHLEAWKKLKAEYEIEPISNEQMVASHLGFAGQFDMVGYVRGKLSVLDIKSGRVDIKAGWQMAAYRLALIQSGIPIEGMAVIQLPRDERVASEPKVFIYEHYDFCLQRFLCALETFKGLYHSKLLAMEWPNLYDFSPSMYVWDKHE